ncbi:NusA-like transcription termination signal-binding factor [archaeon]|nr:NusA-like transcription termination signal-binding factor [archaeon]
MITISADEIKFINYFQDRTNTTVKDCLIEGNDIIVVVKSGQMGLAIGKNGSNINRLKKETGKEIHIYEHADTPQDFIKNMLFPVKVSRVDVNDSRALVYVDKHEKKRAIGHGGKKINLVRELADRHFGVKEIKVM